MFKLFNFVFTSAVFQVFYLGRAELAVLSLAQPSEPDVAYRGALQRRNRVAYSLAHLAYLAVTPLADNDLEHTTFIILITSDDANLGGSGLSAVDHDAVLEL